MRAQGRPFLSLFKPEAVFSVFGCGLFAYYDFRMSRVPGRLMRFQGNGANPQTPDWEMVTYLHRKPVIILADPEGKAIVLCLVGLDLVCTGFTAFRPVFETTLHAVGVEASPRNPDLFFGN